MFSKFIKNIVYVQVNKDSFTLFHLPEKKTFITNATQPFSTTRLAIGNFQAAEETLKTSIKQLKHNSIFPSAPIIVMHQLYKSDGGLCEVEHRILNELAYGSGARQVYIWQGEPLTEQQLNDKAYEKSV